MCRPDKTFFWQFIPREFEHLTKVKTIEYKEYKLKTDYIINIMHELILRYLTTNEESHNLWSSILRRKYGKTYNIYIEYLTYIKFMKLTSNYYAGRKSKTYKLNITTFDITRHKITDNILLKKHSKDYLYRTFTSQQESPIDFNLRKKLIDDLYHVAIDYEKSLDWLNNKKANKDLDLNKYFKNLISIDGINTGHIFFKFDGYGRLHTNFTVLKKYLRNNYLTIDGEDIKETDISNSQPFFFAVYLKNELSEKNFNDEVKKYVECVKNGLIYDQILQAYPDKIQNRNDAKTLMYKVLFGHNKYRESDKMFQKLYPSIYSYIKEYKDMSDSYKELSHELQLLESDFIFGKVVTEIKMKFPEIKLFTIHDSICYPVKYKEEVEIIFRKHLKNLL